MSSMTDVRAAIRGAREIDVLAYTLRPGPTIGALEAAATGGARVNVRLEGAPFDDGGGALTKYNGQVVKELCRFGIDARLAHTDRSQAPVHAKAIVVDRRLFLDDRNWNSNDFIVSENDPQAVAAVTGAVDGRTGDDPVTRAFAIHKRDALVREAALLRAAQIGESPIVETESFGLGNAVYGALDELGKRGLAPRLLVCATELKGNKREKTALARLVNDGVTVRVTRGTEKFAVVGKRAWIGSANASLAFGKPDTIDWGECTGDAATVAAARSRVEALWSAAVDLPSTSKKRAGVAVGRRR
ncbi:MAG: hypothetical protein JOZ01_02400 [Candidatus Eremiobacteraeota bacterium]|nr:hypothetical protein [Candidatus Eremiobacteraeota bacterium]